MAEQPEPRKIIEEMQAIVADLRDHTEQMQRHTEQMQRHVQRIKATLVGIALGMVIAVVIVTVDALA